MPIAPVPFPIDSYAAQHADTVRAMLRGSGCQRRLILLCWRASGRDMDVFNELVAMLEDRDFSEPAGHEDDGSWWPE